MHGGVEFIKEIPKSPAGKILRRFLREHERLKETHKNSKSKIWFFLTFAIENKFLVT